MHTLKVTLGEKIKTISFSTPENLSDLLIANNIYIDRPCNGKGTCGKCKVKFLSNSPKPNSYDEAKLTDTEIEQGHRLSCKCIIETDAHIKVIQKEKMTVLSSGLSSENEICYHDKTLKDFYGLAIDLGTTTIVTYLIRLNDGQTLGVKSAINPQRKYGDNVITRSEYINSNKNGLDTLQSITIKKINELTDTLCKEQNILTNNIKKAVLSGNTIMQHIILGVNPFQITLAPFTPVFTEQKIISASNFGLSINPTADIYITNSISGYIGGDIVSGIIAAGMDKSNDTSLLVDIGTNGEIVLNHNNKMFSCSVAAGPAFEGEHIKFGLGGVAGAINKAVSIDNKLQIETIGNADPIGICGSGLLDIVAYLLDEGIVDTLGTMDESKCQTSDNEIVYYVTENIYISQKDIREIQLAKSAVAAGIEVLLQKAEISYDDVAHVYLAGGFGSYLNVESAGKIGLINKNLTAKCVSAGNTAGMGSIKSLLSDNVLASLNELTQKVEYIELSLDKAFNDFFIENMMF